MIGVIGATGNVGRPLVRELVDRGEHVVALSRRGGEDGPHVRHVAGNLAEPGRLADALRGVRAVFVVVPGSGEGLDGRAIVDAIVSSGARRVVLLSSMAARSRPEALSHEPLRVLEGELKRSGLAWTFLRPGGFDSNAMAWIPSVRAEGTVAAPFGDVALPLVDPEDIAAVAAAALCEEGHAERAYELTGPTAITPREQTEALATALGVPLTFVELSREAAAAAWRAFMPATVLETTLELLGAPNEIEARTSPDVQNVLGRPAQPFAAWAARNAFLFR